MAQRIGHHPAFNRLLKAMAAIKSQSIALNSVVFRCTEPAYATRRDLLTGEGSRAHGGRWNPPSSVATVYAALSDVTALEESKANHRYYGLDPADALPRVLVAIDVKLADVIVLTEAHTPKALSVSAGQLQREDWRAVNARGRESISQAIGRAAYETGLEGLIVTACDSGKNVVWFPGNLKGTSMVAIRNVGRRR